MAKNFRISLGAAGPMADRPYDGQGKVIYTPEEVEQINREQNRRHLNGAELEAMMAFVTAGNIFIQTAPVLFDHADHIGKKRQLKGLVTQFRRLMKKMHMAVELRQMGAVCGQLENARICVSAEPVARYVNIRQEDLLHICNRAMEQCDMCCTCTREESKDCKLRQALELVPGVKSQGKEFARKDATRCPYRGLEMEVEE